MDRGDWRVTVYGVAESGMTEHGHKEARIGGQEEGKARALLPNLSAYLASLALARCQCRRRKRRGFDP